MAPCKVRAVVLVVPPMVIPVALVVPSCRAWLAAESTVAVPALPNCSKPALLKVLPL